MKQHHFVIYGVEHEDGTIDFHGEDSDGYLPDGTVWDDESGEWGQHWDDENGNLDRDVRIAKALQDRLLAS